MDNTIIIAILIFILAFALLRVKKHFKGGGCCGSGSNTIRDKKTLTEPKLGEKKMTIEGMTCENCEIRLENALNRIDGVAAQVSYKKKTAIVSYSKEIPDELLKQTADSEGFKITAVHRVGGWPPVGQPTSHRTVRTVRYTAPPLFTPLQICSSH